MSNKKLGLERNGKRRGGRSDRLMFIQIVTINPNHTRSRLLASARLARNHSTNQSKIHLSRNTGTQAPKEEQDSVKKNDIQREGGGERLGVRFPRGKKLNFF